MSIPERWLVIRVASPSRDDDRARLIEVLLEMGGRAVWEEGVWSVTHLPLSGSAPPDEGQLEVAASRIRAEMDDSDLLVQTAVQDHQDWEELWKVGLEPRRLTDRIVVTPSWKQPELKDGDLVITIDPGMAFGNAEHGTTRGCIRILSECVKSGDRILDIGAGSAILSIAAALLGAELAHAVEGDEWAIETARENAARNGVGDRVTVEERFVTSASVAAYGAHDGVIANIEAGLLQPLLPGLVEATGRTGWLLLSGILGHESEGMTEEVESLGMSRTAIDADGEWRSILFGWSTPTS